MIFTTEQIQQIFGTINYRLAQVVADVLGKDFLSEEDKAILSFYKFDWEKKYNELSPYWKIFLFGRVSALIPNSSILSLSKKDIDKYAVLKQNKEISNRDILEYKAAAFRTYSHIKGMGDKIKASVSRSIASQELSLSVAQRRGDVLKEEIKEGVLKKKAVQSIVSDIGGKLKEWDRDWGRIVETEMQDIYSLGKAQEIMEKSGVDALVFKDVYGGACFPTADTEFLTDEGFKLLKDIRGDEKVASFNIETNTLEYTTIEDKIQYWYEGEMNEYKHHSLNMICTPNHKQLIGIDYHPKEGVYTKNQLIDSSKVPLLTKRAYMYYTVDNWKGDESEEIEIAGKTFNTNSFVKMMGWYLSEGSLRLRERDKNGRYNATQLRIAQSKNKNFNEIEDCLRKTFHTNVYYSGCNETGGSFTVLLDKSYDQFAQWLKSLGSRSYTKVIPREIKLLSKKYLFEFLLSYWKGDGFGGGETFIKGDRHIVTTSKQMADDLSEIILKCGYRPSLKVIDNRGRTTFSKKRNRSFTTRQLTYKVGILTSKHFTSIHGHFRVIENWKGEVGCLQLKKNSTLYIRRNGQSIWSGNCRHCISLYLTKGIGSKPIVFKLSKLIENGTNVGRKVKEWKATLGSVHPFCYDDQTEVLTDEGFKFFKDLNKTEKFLSVNLETMESEYVKAVHWTNQYYEGEMIHRKSKCFDLKTTPNHFHVGQSPYERRRGEIVLKKEKDLPKNFNFLAHLPGWQGKTVKSFLFDKKYYDAELFCEFLGYYISEGSFTEWKDPKFKDSWIRRINISQVKEVNKKEMAKCVKKLFGKVSIQKERIEIQLHKEDSELIKLLKDLGHAHEKFIPSFVKELSPAFLRIFLDAFYLGDGTLHKGVVFDGYQCKPQKIYSTSSLALRDDIGELILKIGKCPSFKNRGKSTYHCKKQNKDYVAKYDQWEITELSSKFRYGGVMKKEIKNYKGFIYDVELERNHTLVIRRNSNVCISGNCRCDLRYLPDGYVWDDEKKAFVPSKVTERKVERRSKVKITVGDKTFEV